MSQIMSVSDNAFAALSFLAAPAILTNASTVLALGTSNRLARASDRAKMAATAIVSSTTNDPIVQFQQADFQHSTRRATLLIRALRRFYLAAACFAAGTCVALVGAFAGYFNIHSLDHVAQAAMIGAAVLGVGGLVHGSLILLRETRLAINSLDAQHAAITQWRASRKEPLA
ncbi:MAG TPA: DUF2721 domain-containing protein [Phycisphaerales bacterium]|nr:DUF2721 domain-containing protein [Phycisphaerales bacterium]